MDGQWPELSHVPLENNQESQRSEFPAYHGMLHKRHCMLDIQEWKVGIRSARMPEIPAQIRHEQLPVKKEHQI